MLAVAGSAAFFGLNIFVGINAVKTFGGSPMIGGVLAAVMSHPSLASISADGIAFAPGRGGVVAVLLVSLFAAWLEKKLHRLIPDMFDLFATPLITVLLSHLRGSLHLPARRRLHIRGHRRGGDGSIRSAEPSRASC